MTKRLGRLIAPAAFVLALAACGTETVEPAPPDLPSWFESLDEASEATAYYDSPVMVAIYEGSFGRYEGITFGAEETEGILPAFIRVRMDIRSDTALVSSWGIGEAPAMVVLDGASRMITRLEGARDPVEIERTLSGVLDHPIPPDDLAADPSLPARMRLIEVRLEMGAGDSAVELARDLDELVGDSEPEKPRVRYLLARSMAEVGDLRGADRVAASYLSEWPDGEDAQAARWIEVVHLLTSGRGRAGERKIAEILDADSSSPFARQAPLAYAVDFLGAHNRWRDSVRYLGGILEERPGFPWKEDVMRILADILVGDNSTLGQALAIYEELASGEGAVARDAREVLSRLALSPRGRTLGLTSEIIVFLERLAREKEGTPEEADVRITLAGIMIADGDDDGASGILEPLAEGEGDDAARALVMLGAIEITTSRDPDAALGRFEAALALDPEGGVKWAARYGRARSLYLLSRFDEATEELRVLRGYFEGLGRLPDDFSLVLPAGATPEFVDERLRRDLERIRDTSEDDHADLALLNEGILASARSETEAAFTAFDSILDRYPASDVADDALLESALLYLRAGEADSGVEILRRIERSYSGTDRYDEAVELLSRLR